MNGRRLVLPLVCGALLAATCLGAAAVVHQHRVQTAGVTAGLPDPRLAPRPDPFAINIALDQYADSASILDSLPPFHWLRQTFAWDQIEPAPGRFQWAKWDTLVDQAMARHKEFIAVLNFAPAWARDGAERAAPPRSADDFARFAGAFAAHYGSRIHVYQIWDEPNIALGWGKQPSAATYAALLQKAYAAIHAADPQATVIAAALAPTTETGPANISDLLYLQQLYDLGAGKYFDAAAGKPYGFYTGPDDRQADSSILNFSRFVLLRQVMEKNGDGHKLLWGGDFGWNTLASPWGQASPAVQASDTLVAYQRALAEWPWAGPLALDNYQPAAAPDDAHWGFALVDASGQLTPLGSLLAGQSLSNAPVAFPGNYSALSPLAYYFGDWKFSELGADISETGYQNARVEIRFQGTDFGLTVRRGDYRGYLYVQVDGQPANRLPRDSRGAYLVLTSPELTPQVVTVPVAAGLDPNVIHTAVIQPERGWGQWALAGFSVGHQAVDNTVVPLLLGLVVVGLASAAGIWKWGGGQVWRQAAASAKPAWDRLGEAGQLLVTAVAGGVLCLSTWLTFGDKMVALTRRFGDAAPLVVTALTAGLFYFSPSALVAVAALIVLFVLLYLRLDLALAFAALFIPFYLQPRLLWQKGFALVEITTVMALIIWGAQNVRPLLQRLRAPKAAPPGPGDGARLAGSAGFWGVRLSSIDLACLALLAVATLSLFTAEFKGVALREYRLVIIDPLIFYFLLRVVPLDRKAWWRIIDFFVLGAVGVTAIGLWQYVTHTGLITAEDGVLRITSVYGSPNNLALYLGRAWPVALAVTLMGRQRWRRVAYGLAVLAMSAAILLTFSKGALLLGLPAALAVIAIGWLGLWGWILTGAGLAASLASLPIISLLPRFANLLNPQGGTSFFRTQVWISAWRMFLDHPVLGVGLDNFLYQYRGHYILPDAWQDPNLSHPHNIALDFLSRLGVLGAACGVWLQVSFWQTAVGAYRRLKADRDELALCVGLMASVADMLAHGMVDNAFFLLDLAFAFFLALAAVQHLRRDAPQHEA
jgi:O-antigen ligase